MTVVRTDWFGTDRARPEGEGPERYAPKQRMPDKLGDADEAVKAFDENREFVRPDVSAQRRQLEPGDETSAEKVEAPIQRISRASMGEIDRVIGDLREMREMLRIEGERVSREIAGYASLCHASTTAMKIIGESLAHWKRAPSPIPPRAAE